MFLFEDGPPCSWGSQLGEGFTSLKTLIFLLSQWNYHSELSEIHDGRFFYMDLAIPIWVWSLGPLVGVRSWTAWFSEVWSIFLMICMVAVNVIYCSPESGNLINSGVWMICNVVCTWCVTVGSFCICGLSVLNGITLSCFYSSCAHPFVAIWSSLCTGHDMAEAVMSAIPRLWSGPISPISIFSDSV